MTIQVYNNLFDLESFKALVQIFLNLVQVPSSQWRKLKLTERDVDYPGCSVISVEPGTQVSSLSFIFFS